MKLGRKDAILYKCWECTGKYMDGKNDCENPMCPLYMFMPYRKQDPQLDFTKFSPKHKGDIDRDSLKRPDAGQHWKKDYDFE